MSLLVLVLTNGAAALAFAMSSRSTSSRAALLEAKKSLGTVTGLPVRWRELRFSSSITDVEADGPASGRLRFRVQLIVGPLITT